MSYTMTIRLDRALLTRLEEAARQNHQPLSTLARRAIADWLDREQPRRATTLLRAAGTVAGSGLPATNENVRASVRRRRK